MTPPLSQRFGAASTRRTDRTASATDRPGLLPALLCCPAIVATGVEEPTGGGMVAARRDRRGNRTRSTGRGALQAWADRPTTHWIRPGRLVASGTGVGIELDGGDPPTSLE